MRRLVPQSLPAWILLIVVAGLIAAQTATLIIASHGVASSGRSFDLFRLGERTVALSKALNSATPDALPALLNDLATPPLTLSMSRQPAITSAIPADDELAELEDILVAKLGRIGVADVRIREADTAAAKTAEPHASVAEDGQGDVEEQLSEAASDLGRSGRFTVSVQFKDGEWLNFVSPVTPDPPVLTSRNIPFYLGAAAAIILLSLWTIRQLTQPYAAFERAVKAIGDDLNRPPLPETGSREVKAAVRAINWMQGKVRDYVSEREHLAAALAHDLRTPVTRLRLRFELLKQKTETRALIADLAEIEAIIQSVVDFANHELHKEADERFDMVSLVETLCDEFPDVRMEHAGAPARIVCTGRPVALKRCLANLIDNAVKYGKSAKVSVVQGAGGVDVVIEDEGEGIPADEIEGVFQPFHRLDRSRNRETGGIGLGLAIARGIARAHHGDISMSQRPEGGMKVVLSLPSAHPGEVESLRRKGFAPNQYLGANPDRQSLQLWRDLL